MGVRIVRPRRSAVAGVLGAIAVLAAAACSGHSASTFTPEGGGSSLAVAPVEAEGERGGRACPA